MKVVLFCGGLGTRIREYSENIPKPMVPIGHQPILWHVMQYYSRYGHQDFILCLGYKGHVIKDYFLHYDESVSNDFVWSQGGKKIDFINRDIDDWTITFVETGINANIAERLNAVDVDDGVCGRHRGKTCFSSSAVSVANRVGFGTVRQSARGNAVRQLHRRTGRRRGGSRWQPLGEWTVLRDRGSRADRRGDYKYQRDIVRKSDVTRDVLV